MTMKRPNLYGVRENFHCLLISLFEQCGFTFIDDIIWDKGEVQSFRNKNNSKPYPFFQYPINCYEHILIFHKHRLDKTKFPCSVCGSIRVSGNTQSSINVQSWECKNPDCFKRSATDRGKRFSGKTILCQDEQKNIQNIIPENILKLWRKDIVKFSPVIKINAKGINSNGHTAPFPREIPEMAIRFFSYVDDIVLDPFAGSCTTALVADELNRKSIMCEFRRDLFQECIEKRLKGMVVRFCG